MSQQKRRGSKARARSYLKRAGAWVPGGAAERD
jgi:hypothetical protein